MGLKDLLINYWWIILIGLFILIVLAFIIGNLQMKHKISKEIELLLNVSKKVKKEKESTTIVEEDLEELPGPRKNSHSNTFTKGKNEIRSQTKELFRT